MVKGFYFKLALSNVKRSREVYLPYFITTAIISSVYFLVCGLIFSKSLTNTPSGHTAQMVFTMGIVVFSIFAFAFMCYINNFLVKRRKKEFGLYGVLGLSKRHVGRVLRWENFIIIGSGVVLGLVMGLVFGQLLFLVLMKMIHSVPDSTFSVELMAYILTLALFTAVYIATSIYNSIRIRMSNPIELLQEEKKGDKPGKHVILMSSIGFGLLAAAYYFAWTIQVSGTALGIFFPLALLVIIATYLLFTSGSIVILKLLRANKKLYYKLNNFVSISGMFHRMKQNAAGLASICILSTMLIVTVSGTAALYLGQEKMLEGMYPFDVKISLTRDPATEGEINAFIDDLHQLSAQNHVIMSGDANNIVFVKQNEWNSIESKNNQVAEGTAVTQLNDAVQAGNMVMFELSGSETDCLAFIKALKKLPQLQEHKTRFISDKFSARQDGYGMYGGLLFLGAFFGILFLAVTILIIYFKQVTEGYEDKERFVILQQVGMDENQVRATINRQILWIFFVPLATTLVHMIFASKIMAIMLKLFMLYDWFMVLSCIGVVCALFALLYLLVYRLTARVYYRIVRW